MAENDTCAERKHWEDGDLFYNCKTRIGADPTTRCVQFHRNWIKAFKDQVKTKEE